MGDLLNLISEDILFIGLFGGDDIGFWFEDDIGINDNDLKFDKIIDNIMIFLYYLL